MHPFDDHWLTRRSFGIHLLRAGAVSVALADQLDDLGALKDGPEVKRFKEAQSRLFSSLRLRVKSRYLRLSQPTMAAHVLEAGRGDPLVFLCGGPTVAAFAPMMAAFAEDHRTLAVDRPGSGLSDRLDYRGMVYRDRCVCFVRGVLDELRIRKTILIGNSMGGYFSLVFALAEPQRVKKIVFLGEVAGSSPDQGTSQETQPAPPASMQSAPAASLERTKASLARVIAHVDRVSPEMIEVMHTAGMMPGINSSMATMMEQIRRDNSHMTYSLRSEMSKLNIPTLFIWGSLDRLGSPELGREMASIMPNARCEVVPDAGHLPWLDQTERCITLTKNFIRVT